MADRPSGVRRESGGDGVIKGLVHGVGGGEPDAPAGSAQSLADRDLAGGVIAHVHDLPSEIRRRNSLQRVLTARARLDAANVRDESAHARDLTARTRDQSAAVRDLIMAAREEGDAVCDRVRAIAGAEIVRRAAEQRKRAAEHRFHASEHRAFAAVDREEAASERVLAARERSDARADREELARTLAIAETDALTGARARAAGLVDLNREIVRCRRLSCPLVVAYIDVVGLKALNDRDGDAAGDALLKRIIALISSQLRPYDLIIRLGGDEFVCALSHVRLAEARRRFGQIAALAAGGDAGVIRAGFADLKADDEVTTLIARADDELTARPS